MHRENLIFFAYVYNLTRDTQKLHEMQTKSYNRKNLRRNAVVKSKKVWKAEFEAKGGKQAKVFKFIFLNGRAKSPAT